MTRHVRPIATWRALRSLRVLFLATRDWYNPATTGGDNTLWENARYLASAGHEVTFVCASFPGSARDTTIDGIHVVRLGGIHSMWFQTFVYYMSRCRGRYDVVVAEGFGGSRIPRLAPLYVVEPIITEWHQIHKHLFAAQYPKLLNAPLNLLERLTAWVHRDTFVRAGTEDWKRAFPSIGFRPDRVFVVPVSIRDDWLNGRHPATSATPRILWLGKVRRYKCPDHVVKAFPKVVSQRPDARLVIAGRHDDRRFERELADLALGLGLQDLVEFRYDIDDIAKRALIVQSRALVVPSAVEGFGIVVLEANACGVPVIASDRVPEGAVSHMYNGVRYKFGDLDALSSAVLRILNDDALWSLLSNNAVAFAKSFGWQQVGARFEEVVQTIAAQPRVHA
jgi:glycosyltransferase involved in cell wall biosynthesis